MLVHGCRSHLILPMPFRVHSASAPACLSVASEDCASPPAWNILFRGVLDLGEERVWSHLHSILHQWEKSEQGRRAGTWREELMLRSWRRAACCLVPHGLLGLFSSRTAPPSTSWALPQPSLGKKMLCRLAYSLSLWSIFLN